MNNDNDAAVDLLDDWMPRLFVGLAILVAVIFVILLGVAMYNSIESSRARSIDISKIEKTNAGKFAVRYFDDCRSSGFISKPTNLECAKAVIDGARDLRDEAFSKDVATSVEKIIEVVK